MALRSATSVQLGEVTGLEMQFSLPLHKGFFQVYAFRAGGVLIDTGPPRWKRLFLDWAAQKPVEAALLTHHHEDHAGNAAALQQRGISVWAGGATAALLAKRFPMLPYRTVLFGRPEVIRPLVFPSERFSVGGFDFDLIPSPGHCDDHLALFEPARGWLFAGDLYLGDRVRVGKKEENIPQLIASLEKLAALEFDALYCAHKPVIRNGKQRLAAKLNLLIEARDQILYFHHKGLSGKSLMAALGWREKTLWKWLTFFDVSGARLIESVLREPCSGEAEHFADDPLRGEQNKQERQ